MKRTYKLGLYLLYICTDDYRGSRSFSIELTFLENMNSVIYRRDMFWDLGSLTLQKDGVLKGYLCSLKEAKSITLYFICFNEFPQHGYY